MRFYGLLEAASEAVEVTASCGDPFFFVGIEFYQIDLILDQIHAIMTAWKGVIDTLEVVQVPLGSLWSTSFPDVPEAPVKRSSQQVS